MHPSAAEHCSAGICPNQDVLTALALGKLPLDKVDQLGGHIEHCACCQDALQALDHLEDSFISDLKECPHSDPLPIRPELERQLQRAEQISELVWKAPVVVGKLVELVTPVT